ncbi:HAD family phosphatase [Candidatus Poribacteria bacterium]|nr:HAD family phosphatase [Candidatus Poribacteria bacterium]
MLKAIIFDFDGVIADTEPIHLKMFQKVLAEEGIILTEEEYHQKYLALDDKGCFSAVLSDNGRQVDKKLVEDMIRRKSIYFDEHVKNNLIIFPGVVDFVRKATPEHLLAIASGALRHEIEFGLEAAGIRQEFQAIVSAEEVEKGKPDPEPFLKALQELNNIHSSSPQIQPSECLVIEDSLHGIAAAHEAGMKCLAVTNSYSADELSEADWVTDSLEDYEFRLPKS